MMCFNIDKQEEVFMKFDLFRFISGFKLKVPTDKVMNECRCINLTSDQTWNPNEFDYGHHLKYVSAANSSKTISYITYRLFNFKFIWTIKTQETVGYK